MKRSRTQSVALKVMLIAGVVMLLTAGGYGVWRQSRNAPLPGAGEQTNQINYDPPTEEEKQAAEDTKQDIDPSPTPPTPAGSLRSVTPTITFADRNGASAYVTGVFEDGGTCTATFTHGGDKITATSEGFQNASYTSCAPLKLASPINIQGDWNVSVSYASKTAAGTSAAYAFKVN
jgi:hypothetical protein